MAAGAGYRFGEFVLNLDRGRLQKAGAELALRPKSFDVLRYLVERAGRLATKDELVSAVWPDVIVSDDSLAQCVRDIRKVLGDDGERFIKTVPRRGYMFVAETAPLTAEEPAAAALAPADHAGAEAVHAGVRRLARGMDVRGRIAPIAALAAIIVLVGAAAAWALGWLGRPPPATTETRLTIAVLPFDAQDEDWLGDGLAEDIMTAVSRFRDLTVIGRTSSFRYRGNAVDVRQVGKDLGAHYVLQGSVRRRGEQVRITAQLVTASTAAVRWTERYDRPFADVFAIQDDVVAKVAGQLFVQMRDATVARLRGKPPANLEVYELALRARMSIRAFTREGATEAQALCERAIALDPGYARAWEVLADALIHFYLFPYNEHQLTLPQLQRARAAAEKAVALAPDDALAQAVLGFILMWAREHDASFEALHKAVSLNPSEAGAHRWLAAALYFAGLNRESIEVGERADRLDPFYPALVLALRSRPYTMLGDFEPALRLTRTCAERLPKLVTCHVDRAAAAAGAGLDDEARAAAKRLLEVYPRFTIARHVRSMPFRNEADAARFAGYLRRAGLPE
jgi:TolB-like protein/DNA-binding winged helix-turn-helix (wHTH) protein/Flp pilus assembly protein TadD